MKIYVAGHRGLVGSAIVRKIDNDREHTWIGKSRAELDLFNYDAVRSFLKTEMPDAVVVAAAKVGGIGANSKYPVEFLNENLRIELNLLEASHSVGIPRLLFLGSSCIYPKFASQPIKESELLTGSLEPTNEPYAIAKIAGLKMVEAYAAQYGHDWISAMPTNIYGPNDNFDLETAHVLPALMNRFHQAKLNNSAEVTLWGTGSPMREFLHSDDLASACLFMLDNIHSAGHFNVGTGKDVSIRSLADLLKEVTAFQGSLAWDHSKPDGTPRKVLDVSKLESFGWRSSIELSRGVHSTYSWFVENIEKISRI
jgi:GDP-L-fucose synthase